MSVLPSIIVCPGSESGVLRIGCLNVRVAMRWKREMKYEVCLINVSYTY